jgi:hypothetical protein
MVCFPAAKLAVDQTAVPLPLTGTDPSNVAPSLNETEPVAFGGPALRELTAAVKEISVPAAAEYVDGVKATFTGAVVTVNDSLSGVTAA